MNSCDISCLLLSPEFLPPTPHSSLRHRWEYLCLNGAVTQNSVLFLVCLHITLGYDGEVLPWLQMLPNILQGPSLLLHKLFFILGKAARCAPLKIPQIASEETFMCCSFTMFFLWCTLFYRSWRRGLAAHSSSGHQVHSTQRSQSTLFYV